MTISKREMNVRLWNIPKKQMYYFDDIFDFASFWGALNHQGPDVYSSDFLLLEYTGLKDKKGKEIYEGDVTDEGVVEWVEDLTFDLGGASHPGFYFKNLDNHDLDFGKSFEDCEVIGNVFENPELLK